MNLEPATWIALALVAALAVYIIVLCWIDDCPHKGSDDDR